MTLRLIFARAANGVIGQGGTMPWHLPEDLAHFKQLTLGSPVVMGRKTWDSLPPRFRPLPGRANIVVTRQADWRAEGAQRAADLPEALALAHAQGDTAWVIGGAQIYAQALPLAEAVEVTEIHHTFEGDAFAPQLGPEWQETARTPVQQSAQGGLPYSFVSYRRR
ncbi:dihydrofolate reductase [Acidovorax sp. FG27]|uniref:dihydrofolate reductase n=1 Tax=Acidovorax sp. FG27 TaxID=3133652 RepID=UPI0030E90492